MNIKLVSLVAVLPLSGCLTAMNTGTKKLLGHNIEYAINRLGYPSGQREIAGDTVYVWSRNAGGMAAAFPVGNASFAFAGRYYCVIQLGTDTQGTIIRVQWEGNVGGCAAWMPLLSK